MSLKEILCQAMEQLGYYSTEEGPVHTREDLYQGSFQFQTMPDPTAEPMFTIYGKALPHRCEAKDNTLIRALIFIDDMPWGTRLAMLSMLTTSCFGIIFVG